VKSVSLSFLRGFADGTQNVDAMFDRDTGFKKRKGI